MTEPITSLPAAVAAQGALPMPVGPDWETAIRAALGSLEGTHHQLPPGTVQAVTERLIESLRQYVLVPKWEYELLEGQRDRATRAEQRIAELEGVTIARLHRKVDSLKSELKRSDDEYEAVVGERDRALELVAELEALKPAPIQTCRKCGAGYTYGQPCSACEFKARMAAETARIDTPPDHAPKEAP